MKLNKQNKFKNLLILTAMAVTSCGAEYDTALDTLETSYNQQINLIENAEDKFEMIATSDILDLSNKIDSNYSKLMNALSNNKLNDERLARLKNIQNNVLKRFDIDTVNTRLLTPNEMALLLYMINNISDSVITIIETAIGHSLSKGLNPPKLDEKYQYVPYMLYNTDGIFNDGGWQVATLIFKYLDDGRINIISFDGENENEAIQGIIWGDNNIFTIYAVSSKKDTTGVWSRTADVYCGEIDGENNIINFTKSFIMLEKKNDKANRLMNVGDTRIFKSYNDEYVENITNKELFFYDRLFVSRFYYMDGSFLGRTPKISERIADILRKRDRGKPVRYRKNSNIS